MIYFNLLQIFWVLGSAFSTILAFIVMPTMGWRWLLAFSAIPLIIFIAACFVSSSMLSSLESLVVSRFWILVSVS